MPRKKTLLVLFILLILAVAILAVLNKKAKRLTTVTPTPSARVVNPQGDTILVETKEYQIVYIPQQDQYLITIYASPFNTYRQLAEASFIKVLNITPEAACKLDVLVGTPYFINPQESERTYPLSFCNRPSPSPNLLLDPRLAPLAIERVHPPQGEVEMGTTTNSIFVTFSSPIDKNTANIVVDPPITTTTKSHPQKPNELIIAPQSPWQSDTSYTVTIKAGLRSDDNQTQLKQDLILEYQVKEVLPTEHLEGGA